MKAGKRTKLNQKSRKMIAKYCEERNLCYCENCGGTFGLAPAHNENRNRYHTAEELAAPQNWIALCYRCHTEIEGNREKTDEIFKRLRPNNE
jgi:hypothetical protein